MADGPVTVRLLGGFAVLRGDEAVERLRTRKTEALLAFLAVRPGERRSREELVERFWPDDPPEVGRQKLRLALNSIRGVVGEVLESDRMLVRLVGVETDVASLRQTLKAAAGEDRETRLAEVLDGMDPTVMPGHTDEETLTLRGEVASEVAEGWRERARLATARDDAPMAARCLTHVLDLEPFGLADHRAMIAALRKARRPGAVRTHLARMRTLLGTIPEDLEPTDSEEAWNRPADSFVGRELQLGALVERLLGDREPVLVTLVGPGGVGKTRLAQELLGAAAEAEVEAKWLGLADVEDTAELGARVGRALNAERGTELSEAALSAPPTLLILDNLEQMDAASVREVVGHLVQPGSGLRILATSQRPLEHPAEEILDLPPLGVPVGEERAQVAASASGRLFALRAGNLGSLKSLSPGTAASVSRICRRLEGLPLALELAASWTDVLSLDELDRQLAESLPNLGTNRADRPDRHRSVRAAIAWGLSRLSAELQRAHARLSVLPASFNLAAAVAVAGLDPEGLRELVLRSLVARERSDDGSPRFRLLEPVRRVAEERLTPEDRAKGLVRLAEHFSARAVAEFSHDRGGLEPDHGADLPNFELALDQLRAEGQPERAGEVVLALYLLWFRLGHPESGISRIEAVYEELPAEAALTRAATANTLGAIGYFTGDRAAAAKWFGLRLHHLQDVGTPFQIAGARTNVGIALQMDGRYEEAAANFREALTVVLDGGIPRQKSAVLINLGSALFALGEREEGRACYGQALAVADEHGLSQLVGDSWQQMAEDAWLNGEYELATAWFERAIEMLSSSSDRLRHVESLASLAMCRIERGDLPHAAEALAEVVSLLTKISGAWTWRYVLEAARAFAESGDDLQTAAQLAGASERLSQGMMVPQPKLETHFVQAHKRLERRMGGAAYRAARTIGETLSRKELRARLERYRIE